MFTKRDICTEKVTIDYSYYSFDEETDRLYKQYIDKNYYIVDITPLGESSYLNRNRHFLVRYVKPKYHVHQKIYYNATLNYTAPGRSLGTFTTKEDAEQCRKEHALNVVNDKVFDNLQNAETYQNKLKVKNLKDYPISSFDEIVYYKIFTKHGDRFNRRTKCNGAFSSTADAYKEMQNHANDRRPNGTGWMKQITITKEANGTITTRSETIYENT